MEQREAEYLADLTWEEARAAAAAGSVAIVPTGSLEQHGPHLPLRVDTALVAAVAEAAARLLPAGVRALLTPPLWLGASHHHLPFFAVSVEERTYVDLAAQVGASLAGAGFRRIFFLNGHGGNAAPLRLALSEISRRHRTRSPPRRNTGPWAPRASVRRAAAAPAAPHTRARWRPR